MVERRAIVALCVILMTMMGLFSSTTEGERLALRHGMPSSNSLSRSMRERNVAEAEAAENAYLNSDFYRITVEILVGPARRPFDVILDTGSFITAIPLFNCTDCSSDTPNYPYNTTGNDIVSCSSKLCSANICYVNTTNCAFDAIYIDGSGASGYLLNETVTLGNITGPALIGGIMSETEDFSRESDGIMGLTRAGTNKSCSPNCVPTILQAFVRNNLTKDLFGIQLDVNGTGNLVVGSVDKTLFTGDLVYTPLVPSFFYTVVVNDMTVRGSNGTQDLNLTAEDFGEVVVDSGSSRISLPPAVYGKLKQNFQTYYCHIKQVCNRTTIFDGYCQFADYRAQLPNLTFHFNGVDVTISPYTYMIYQPSGPFDFYCFTIDNSTYPGSTTLGYGFMRERYISYENANNRIGFSNAVVTNTSSTGGSTTGPVAATTGTTAGSTTTTAGSTTTAAGGSTTVGSTTTGSAGTTTTGAATTGTIGSTTSSTVRPATTTSSGHLSASISVVWASMFSLIFALFNL